MFRTEGDISPVAVTRLVLKMSIDGVDEIFATVEDLAAASETLLIVLVSVVEFQVVSPMVLRAILGEISLEGLDGAFTVVASLPGLVVVAEARLVMDSVVGLCVVGTESYMLSMLVPSFVADLPCDGLEGDFAACVTASETLVIILD